MTTTLARISVVATLFALVPTGAARASHLSDTDSVTINPTTVSGCGSQSVTISGTANFSEPTQHLVVTVDGAVRLHSHTEDSPWTLGSVPMTEGSHTVNATIYDHSSHADPVASQSQTVTVPSCDGNSSTSSSSVSSGSGDCCPGSDEPAGTTTTVQKVSPKGRVKGATTVKTGKLPIRLLPINNTFQKVYGRGPTFAEWEYWARRQWSDKSQYDALYGAMQWHKNVGHSTGGPNPILL